MGNGGNLKKKKQGKKIKWPKKQKKKIQKKEKKNKKIRRKGEKESPVSATWHPSCLVIPTNCITKIRPYSSLAPFSFPGLLVLCLFSFLLFLSCPSLYTRLLHRPSFP